MLRFYKYRLPFKKTFTISGNKYLHREGIILAFQYGEITAFGEVAPLPGFSKETLKQVEEVLTLNREILQQNLQEGNISHLIEVFEQVHNFPSLSFGLDTLQYDLAAKKEKVSFYKFLFQKEPTELITNATLPISSNEQALLDAESLVKNGHQTLKIKVGAHFDNELELLRLLRNKFPTIKLRIDANQAWSVKETITNLKKLEHLQIEYCEQPVSSENIEGLRVVKDSTTIEIAADESFRNKNDLRRLLKAEAVDLLILKPSLLGSFKNIFVTKRMADSHNIGVIVTTCLESAVARSAIAGFSLEFGSQKHAQGLATGTLFKEDVGANNWLDKSIIRWPIEPGLGISVEFNELEEI